MIKNRKIYASLLVLAIMSISGICYGKTASRQIIGSDEVRNLDSYNFIGLSSEDKNGGAIYNEGTISNINGTFKNNSAIDGGAIYNKSMIDFINQAIFKQNSATPYNGAINAQDEWQGYGGAIYNSGTIGIINDSIFENNRADFGGGAIYSNRDLKITNSTFSENSVSVKMNDIETIGGWVHQGHGGAIATSGENLEINNTIFRDNSAADVGGAIYSESNNLKISNSKFYNNTAIAENFDSHSQEYELSGEGGAIELNGNAEIVNSEFIENKSGDGGAINANTRNNITISDSLFVNNTAHIITTLADKSVIESGYGGAINFVNAENANITNTSFESNQAGSNGGAIALTQSSATITDSSFINNTAQNKGGAIYIGKDDYFQEGVSDLSIVSKDKNVVFTGNRASLGNDIYIDKDSNLSLIIASDKNIIFDGGIVGRDASIYIGNHGDENGKVILNAPISPEENSSLNVTINGETYLSDEQFLNGTDLKIQEGGVLDLMNNKIGTVELNSLTAEYGGINIDMDLASEGQNFDFITANSASGGLYLEKVNILTDLDEGINNVPIPLELLGIPSTLEIKTNGTINSLTNDYLYSINANGHNISISRLTDGDGNAQKIDSFTLAVNQTDTVGGVDVSLSEDRTFSATSDIEITGATDTGWTGELGGTGLTVNGQGYTLNGGENNGFSIGDGQTLTFNDTNISGFVASDDRKGALTVNDGGILNIHAINNDVTLGGVNAQEGFDKNTVYLDGTSSSAFMQTSNGKEITVNNDIRSSNKGNVLSLSGDGKIIFNGIVDPITLTNTNANTVHNDYLDDVIYNLNGGVVTVSKDAYLNGIDNKNTLNFNGGTLNIANGAVGNIDLAALNISALSNIMVDADLANEKMDKLSADSVNATDKLNVSTINLLSDAKQDVVTLNFTENSTLASAVTTNVGEVAYSDIYKYRVGYDPTKGDFTFTRGGGFGANNYNAYNPAVMVSPVAAQLGGYMGMLDTYNNAFHYMDMQMLKPSSMRISEQHANQYAITEGQSSYKTNETNSKGIWVRPFAAYDSVGLKNGPKVHNMSYGTFLGGDSEVFKLKRGFYGVISPYIAYQGNHQSFAGNSIYQNGGTLGLSTTLYRGNFFNGTTIGVGMNVADASTMYGSENFPMLMAGIANKTGYNWEFKEGKFIIQPSVMLSYTFVNTFDYTNGAGLRIKSDPLNAIQIAPSMKFIYNTKRGWQPYAHFGMMWNIMDNTKVMASTTTLPELSVKPYFQYGVGVQKLFKDNFTAYGQVMLRSGGRNGVAAYVGGRYLLGRKEIKTNASSKEIKGKIIEPEVKPQYRNLDSL